MFEFFTHLFEAYKQFDNVKFLSFIFKPGETKGMCFSAVSVWTQGFGLIFLKLCLTSGSIPLDNRIVKIYHYISDY